LRLHRIVEDATARIVPHPCIGERTDIERDASKLANSIAIDFAEQSTCDQEDCAAAGNGQRVNQLVIEIGKMWARVRVARRAEPRLAGNEIGRNAFDAVISL
jgi:hypothetical protein